MPLAAAGVGFTVTLGLLFTLWALMCYTALLLLEVYQHVPADMGLGSLAARYLGRYGQWVTGFCMLFLLYALTAAYISGAGELLASSLNQWLDWQLPPAAGVLIFTLLGGAVVCIGTRWWICSIASCLAPNRLPGDYAGPADAAHSSGEPADAAG